MACDQKSVKSEVDPIQDTSCPTNNVEVKVKKEKIDPEIENKIKMLSDVKVKSEKDSIDGTQSENNEENSNDSQTSASSHTDEQEDKKNIEPVKSSNEILAELFSVFNAAPPALNIDDKNLVKKVKKSKKEKKKKNKSKTDDDSSSADGDTTNENNKDNEQDEKSKHKKKKKHKHKSKSDKKSKDIKKEKDKHSKEHKKSKERDKDAGKEGEKGKNDVQGTKDSQKSKITERHRSKGRDASKERIKEIASKVTVKTETSHTHADKNRKRTHEKDVVVEPEDSKRSKVTIKSEAKKLNSFYNGFSERSSSSRHNKRDIKTEKDRRISEGGKISDISLSDEETYLKEKERKHNSDSSRSRIRSTASTTTTNSFYAGVKRSRSRERDRERDRDRWSSRHDGYYSRYTSKSSGGHRSYRSRSRSRSARSRSRSRDLGIDKKRLLEIARKNAISMFKRGNLPGCDNMSQEIKDKVLLKMRYGGRTVQDLTEFCKKISNGEQLSELSSDEDSDVDKSGNAKAFHHPFQLNEREPIVMHIKNSKPILPVPVKADDQTKAIMQFPVSSGQQHRMSEAWIPVEKKENLAPLPALPAVVQSTTIFKASCPKNALGKPMPVIEQEPAFRAVPAQNETTATIANASAGVVAAEKSTSLQLVPISAKPSAFTAPAVAVAVAAVAAATNTTKENSTFIPEVPIPSTNSSIFPQQVDHGSMDVSSIISKRLTAMRRLQDNPLDPEAIKMMYNSQKEMTSWASSKHLPGQFTGSTGVNVLRPNELNSGPQVWARKDQLTSSKPVTGGMGMHLLQKMGWKPGEGLGREKNGALQPLLLDVKLDKKGLVAQEDGGNYGRRTAGGGVVKKRNTPSTAPLEGIGEKHPVCLLNELTSKRKWTPPLYTVVTEHGPSHSRMFLFSVQVNGKTFTPDKASNNKKEAKLLAAKQCLQHIGILPPV